MEIRQHAATDARREPQRSAASPRLRATERNMSTHWFTTTCSASPAERVQGDAGCSTSTAPEPRQRGDHTESTYRLPSGRENFGNLDYGRQSHARGQGLGRERQLHSTSSTRVGFSWHVMTVTGLQAFFEVERRKYRFRILNAGCGSSRSLSTPPDDQIANDGNCCQARGHHQTTSWASRSATTSSSTSAAKHRANGVMVNLSRTRTASCRTTRSRCPALAEFERSCVGRFLEFASCAIGSRYQPGARRHDPNPDLSAIPWRDLLSCSGMGSRTTTIPSLFRGPGASEDGGDKLDADSAISAARGSHPRDLETGERRRGWIIRSHPLRGGQILKRTAARATCGLGEGAQGCLSSRRTEASRYMQFRTVRGMFMEHCTTPARDKPCCCAGDRRRRITF